MPDAPTEQIQEDQHMEEPLDESGKDAQIAELSQAVKDLQKLVLGSGSVSRPSMFSSLPQLKSFTGKPNSTEWDEHAVTVEQRMKAMGIPEKEYVLNALATLSSGAVKYAKGKGITESSSWDELMSVMKSGPWGNRSSKFRLRSLLLALKQGTDPAADFVKRAEDLFDKLPEMAEDEKSFWLLHGLHSRLREKAFTDSNGKEWANYGNLAEFVCNAGAEFDTRSYTDVASGFNSGKRPRPADGDWQVVKGKDKGKVSSSKQFKPYEARDQLSPTEKERLDKLKACYKCKQPGHRANDRREDGSFVCPRRNTK
jgi:hypothetical protein